MPPTEERPQTFNFLQSSDPASPAVRLFSYCNTLMFLEVIFNELN